MREPFEWVEIDLPKCSRTYGIAPCTAALGTSGVRKCFNCIATCQDVANFALGTPLTLKFSKANSPAPAGFASFPVLESVTQSSTTVNIAGADPKFGALGRRSTLDFTLIDFTHHDRGIDPYQPGRVDGTAQIDEAGYDPASRGTELAKIKARYPNYAGAETRLNRAYIDGGVFSDVTTYYHQLTEMAGPSDGKISCKALDILDLANEKTALCPKPSQGVLTLDLTAVATTFDITPTEAATAYAASGWVCIGSEVMAFTRSGVTFTVTRGQRRTVAATHSQGDTVQQTYSVRGARLDDVANDLIANFTTVNVATWVPFADWQAEVTRWGASILLESDICTPTPVATLLAEFGDLGCTIVPDERAQKIRLRMNRPVDGDTVYAISDTTAYEIKQEDLDDQRLTQVLFLCKRADPTKAITDNANYLSRRLTINNDALDIYKEIKSRTIATRWLDLGDDATASIVSWRTLKRFEKAPKRITARIDAAQKAISLMDVANLTTDDLADAVGKTGTMQTQVIGRSEPTPYHDVSVILQRFDFDGRYGYIMQDTANVYGSATADEKANGAYIVDETLLKFPDGTGPYKVI